MPKFNLNKNINNTRQGYENSRKEFSDWVNRLGWEKTLWGSLLLKLEESIRLQRLVFAFSFSLLLSFLILFEWQIPLDFKIGENAKITIHSPLSFQMIDEVSTELKRQDMESKITPVLDYDLTLYDKFSTKIIKAFRESRVLQRDLITKSVKLKNKIDLRKNFEEILESKINDSLFFWLIKNQFSVQIETQLLKTLEEWMQNKVISSEDYDKFANYKTVSVRVLNQFGREFVLDKSELLSVKFENGRVIFNKEVSVVSNEGTEEKDNLIMLAQQILKPNIFYNDEETALRRKNARTDVEPIVMSIKKNQNILNEGSVVQPIHMALFHFIDKMQNDSRPKGLFLIISILFTIVILVAHSFFKRYSANSLSLNSKDYLVISFILFSEVFITKLFLFVTENSLLVRFGNVLPNHFFLFFSPLAAGSILVALLIPIGEVVFIFTLVLSIVVALMSQLSFPLAFVVCVGGLAAARGVQNCKARNDIYWAGMRSGLVMSLSMFCLFAFDHPFSPSFLRESLWMMFAGFSSGILSSMWATIFIPLLEALFNYTTDVKLLELSNLNHPLLKEMLIKAPGTYHHSMMVGSMVEAASEEIGANPLLGKVLCYYHDIGKMAHPNYFIENQKQGVNPHDSISPYMSKTLLIAHVKDGVEMGLKYKLGKPIIDGMIQHHGTTVISYFYNKALEQTNNDHQSVNEEEFRYPGPKPQFREVALCMLADSIEAAARTLDEPTPARLQNIVRNVIQRKFLDGQLDECQLTLKDLTKVEAAFVRILLGIYHQRIDYPRSTITKEANSIAKIN